MRKENGLKRIKKELWIKIENNKYMKIINKSNGKIKIVRMDL